MVTADLRIDPALAALLADELLAGLDLAPDRFWSTGEWNCTVRDENGLTLFVLHFFATGAPATLR